MKIIDVPQSGKCGLTVTFPSRNGLVRRAWVVPANPQSIAQLAVRARLATQASAYDGLTEAQQNAWIAAASTVQSKPRLGQSGPLTGLQLFVRLNANLTRVGEPALTTPSDRPTFDANIATGLELTNWGGWWRNRYRENPDKARRVLADIRSLVRERKVLGSPGAAAFDLWARLP